MWEWLAQDAIVHANGTQCLTFTVLVAIGIIYGLIMGSPKSD